MKQLLLKIGSIVADLTQTITISLSIWLVAYLFIGHGTKIYGASMEPTFHNDQCVFTDTLGYKLHNPVRGDVISLHAPLAAHCAQGTGCDFFKRIIGLPGEDVSIENDTFFINGKKLNETYIPETTRTIPGPFIQGRIVHLQAQEYFVAGDNREHSSDSRFWGPIMRSDIIGKAIIRYCPSSDIGILQSVTY